MPGFLPKTLHPSCFGGCCHACLSLKVSVGTLKAQGNRRISCLKCYVFHDENLWNQFVCALINSSTLSRIQLRNDCVAPIFLSHVPAFLNFLRACGLHCDSIFMCLLASFSVARLNSYGSPQSWRKRGEIMGLDLWPRNLIILFDHHKFL